VKATSHGHCGRCGKLLLRPAPTHVVFAYCSCHLGASPPDPNADLPKPLGRPTRRPLWLRALLKRGSVDDETVARVLGMAS
jgi:hypothetical protein